MTYLVAGAWVRSFTQFTARVSKSGHEVALRSVDHP
jgi:peptidoglycan/xylan/chitin deacetylase (PgdA/CDA1 family)